MNKILTYIINHPDDKKHNLWFVKYLSLIAIN